MLGGHALQAPTSAADAGVPAESPRTSTCVFISPLSCDLIFGLNTKAIWGLDSCQVKGPISYPTCLHASL